MAKGCDSSWDFDYKSRVDALVDEGYTFIGRYLNHSAGVRNGLTVSEANRLSNAGVFICALYESDSGTSISHFTRSNGIADAREAISLAEDLGMPTGNPIYFCIDTDVTKSQMTTYIVPYCSIYSILHHVCSPQYCHRIRFSEIKYCGQKMCFLPTIFLDNGLPVCV